MTLTLLDLYNTASSQEWSMYDSDALTQGELENSLVIALNKALTEILYSYPFKFREKTHVLLTIPKIAAYDIPKGIILKDELGDYCVKINTQKLKYSDFVKLKGMAENCQNESPKTPKIFSISGDKLILYPVPLEKMIVTIDYQTLAVGEDSNGEDIYALKNINDKISVPEHLEELLKNAVIARTMLNSIASETDENFSAYKKQSETAYRLLIKYSKGLTIDKNITF